MNLNDGDSAGNAAQKRTSQDRQASGPCMRQNAQHGGHQAPVEAGNASQAVEVQDGLDSGRIGAERFPRTSRDLQRSAHEICRQIARVEMHRAHHPFPKEKKTHTQTKIYVLSCR